MKNKHLSIAVWIVVLSSFILSFVWAALLDKYQREMDAPKVNLSFMEKGKQDYTVIPAYLPVIVNSKGVSFTGTDNKFHVVTNGYVVIKSN